MMIYTCQKPEISKHIWKLSLVKGKPNIYALESLEYSSRIMKPTIAANGGDPTGKRTKHFY